MPEPPLTTDAIFDALCVTADLLDAADVPFRLTYGTLLGAVRDGEIIPWDWDFDLQIYPADLNTVLALDGSDVGIRFEPTIHPSRYLAMTWRDVEWFSTCALKIFHCDRAVGDLYWFHLFDDGVLRRYDPQNAVYWCPRSSYPEFFLQTVETVTLRGRTFPGIGHADRFLAGVYGSDWRKPYRAVAQGGEARSGFTKHGDRFAPKLADEIAWAQQHGWDRAAYAEFPHWPADLAGAGPIGPHPRTKGGSRSTWWRDLDELRSLY